MTAAEPSPRPAAETDTRGGETLTCPVTAPPGSNPCGKPAQVYPMPLGVTHTACPRHRLIFLAMIGSIHESMYGPLAPNGDHRPTAAAGDER